jgi:hypothetical protein
MMSEYVWLYCFIIIVLVALAILIRARYVKIISLFKNFWSNNTKQFIEMKVIFGRIAQSASVL